MLSGRAQRPGERENNKRYSPPANEMRNTRNKNEPFAYKKGPNQAFYGGVCAFAYTTSTA